MTVFDIISYFRNMPELNSETKLPTAELLRLINLAYERVSKAMVPAYGDLLTVTRLQSVTGYPGGNLFTSTTELLKPPDADEVKGLLRETANGTGAFATAMRVPVEKRADIGVDPNLPIRSDYPLFIEQHGKIEVWPVFPAGLGIKIYLQYKRYNVGLIFGSYTPSSSVDTFVLEDNVVPVDDWYNEIEMGFYEKTSDLGWKLSKQLRVSDYVAATRTLSFTGAYGNDEFTAQEYLYASVPWFPYQHHQLLVDAAAIELMRVGKLDVSGVPKAEKELGEALKPFTGAEA